MIFFLPLDFCLIKSVYNSWELSRNQLVLTQSEVVINMQNHLFSEFQVGIIWGSRVEG